MEFPGGQRAADSVDLKIQQGECVSIVGRSGCGKTTLLRVLAGLQTLSSGRCVRHTETTSFVFQQPALLPWRSVVGNVMLPLELLSRRRRRPATRKDLRSLRQRADAAIDEVELGDAADQFPYELSGGMRMRVSIARALVTRPDLLLLDEPFAALDDMLRTQLGSLVTELWRTHRFTMVLVTHNIAEAIALSDRICVMHAGRIETVLDNPVTRLAPPQSTEQWDVRRTAEFGEFYGTITDRLRGAAQR
ncbi:Aliphatic sulfonates import ATP-binding protein SsuB [Allorhodopirellula solitaria]|uniref:Aliphatic sulfonates import ATP-binding protein SsuB n=1 Tax=Allorhodopirellula solitaria TaxID=2527987 RepID=A0A5C5XPB8_9BACT|nr:Aliphatic sulfonates import ATP-binding protein SsuB [Allorhodopirellula solitaria]